MTALHEPKPSRTLRIASARFLAGRTSRANMALLLERKRRKLYAGIGTPIYLESNPYWYGFLDVLGEVFAGPRIVHITRDPRTMVRSALNFGTQRGLKRLFSAVVPYWKIRPELLDRNPPKRWWQMSPLERIAWHWRVVNSHLDRGAELYGQDYRRFRYEDLFLANGGGLGDLAEWIGVGEDSKALADMARSPVNRSMRQVVAEWDRWPEADRRTLLGHCAELMQTYGYDVDTEVDSRSTREIGESE